MGLSMTPDDALDLIDALAARGITLRCHGPVIYVSGPAGDHLRDLITREAGPILAALQARTTARRAIDSAQFLSRPSRWQRSRKVPAEP